MSLSAASSLTKIHVNNATGVSLNERFTAISHKTALEANQRSRTRSRSRSHSVSRSRSNNNTITHNLSIDRAASLANQRLLQQLQRKHKLQAALKLKRRSMRTMVAGTIRHNIKRDSVKAFRVGANGKAIRTNSLSNIPTMNADREMLNSGRTLRRMNFIHRLGSRRGLTLGGAAKRIELRRLERQSRSRNNGRSSYDNNMYATADARSRSRSRSNTRNLQRMRPRRNRSRSIQRGENINMGRQIMINTHTRGRSRSRTRETVQTNQRVPIKARLGMRFRGNQSSVGARRLNNRRNGKIKKNSSATGRIQKRRNSAPMSKASGDVTNMRLRARSAVRNLKPRNMSVQRQRQRMEERLSKGAARQRQQRLLHQNQKQTQPLKGNLARRRRSRSLNYRSSKLTNKQGNNSKGAGENVPQQGRRSRSRSRSRNNARGRNNQGKQNKLNINKDDLDKELDQYMATTKTENEVNYLLTN